MIATTLGRTQQELSWLREELIEEGDVYAPKRGQLAMAVPLFNQYVLSHYERTRPEAGTPLLSLDQMIANARLVAPWIPGTGNPEVLEPRRQGQDRQLPPADGTAGPPRS